MDQYAQMGGAQRLLIDTVSYFQAHGESCTIALPEKGPVRDALRGLGADVREYALPRMTSGTKKFAEKIAYAFVSMKARDDLAQIATSISADLIYCNAPRAILPVMLAARRLNLPAVASLHLVFRGPELTLLRRFLRDDHFKCVTFCSQLAAEPFKGQIGDKGIVLPNWVSPHFFDYPVTPNARKYLDLEQGQIAVGILGRVSKNKGQRLFLEALLPVLDSHRNCRLFIGGSADFEDAEEEASLKELVRSSHHVGLVRFLGPVSNAEAFLDAMDVAVVASKVESFGLVAVEAAARGVPVVCTGGAVAEIVEDGVTGLVVRPEPCALGRAVQSLIEDPIKREEMGEQGRARAKRLYSAEPRLSVLLEYCRLAGKVER